MSNTDEKAAMAFSQPRLIFNEALCSILKKEQKIAFNEMGPPFFTELEKGKMKISVSFLRKFMQNFCNSKAGGAKFQS